MATPEGHNLNGPETFQQDISKHVFRIWPELTDIQDQVELIYAGFHPIFSFIARNEDGIKDQIQSAYINGKRHFMFECMGEAFPPDTIEKIHKILDNLLPRLADSSFYYLTGAIDGEDMYNRVSKRLNVNPYIKILGCHHCEFTMNKGYREFTQDEYVVRLRDKNYLCFNKVHRQHRIDLLELLLEKNLINDKCYYSFHDYSMNGEEILHSLLDEHYPNIKNKLEFIKTLQLNYDPDRSNPVDVRINDIELYDNSYFSVVTETSYYGYDYDFPKSRCHVSPVEPGVFITEKTLKPISLNHPFIMVTVPYSIRALKNRGYKTFSPYIDESYDEITDDDLRMLAITNEIERLSNQTNDQWLEWCHNIKPIVEYNRKHFFDQTTFRA